MTRHFPEETEDVLLNRKEASRELATLGIRRAPSPYYPRSKLHEWARSQLTGLRSSSSQPRRQGGWAQDTEPSPPL
jgi:hypothetical protein